MIPLLSEGLPANCMTGTFNSHGGLALAVTILGLIAAIYSLVKGLAWLRESIDARRRSTPPPDRHTPKSVLLILWLLAPPAWLFVEDIFLYRAFGKPACFDFFRHAQHLVLTGWLPLVAALFLLYFGRDIFGKD